MKFGGSQENENKANVDKELITILESLKLKSPEEIATLIGEQGDKVRQLKAAKSDKKIIEHQVKILVELKKLSK